MILERLDQIKWTAQSVFDHVVKHLLTQKKQAMNDDGDCYYHKVAEGETLACAVGCLIPNRYYREDMENMGVNNLIDNRLHTDPKQDPLRKRLEKHRDLLSNLQSIHDLWPPKEWPDRLRRLADENGLEYHGD